MFVSFDLGGHIYDISCLYLLPQVMGKFSWRVSKHFIIYQNACS